MRQEPPLEGRLPLRDVREDDQQQTRAPASHEDALRDPGRHLSLGAQFNSFVEISTDFSTDFSTEFLVLQGVPHYYKNSVEKSVEKSVEISTKLLN